MSTSQQYIVITISNQEPLFKLQQTSTGTINVRSSISVDILPKSRTVSEQKNSIESAVSARKR